MGKKNKSMQREDTKAIHRVYTNVGKRMEDSYQAHDSAYSRSREVDTETVSTKTEIIGTP